MSGVWIGASDIQSEGSFTWDGSNNAVSFTNFELINTNSDFMDCTRVNGIKLLEKDTILIKVVFKLFRLGDQ